MDRIFLSTMYMLLIIILFAILFYYRFIYLKLMLAIALASLIYVLEQKEWYYHIYPAIAFSILTLAVIHIDNKNSTHKTLTQFLLKKGLTIIYVVVLLTDLAVIASNYFYYYESYKDKNSFINRLVQFSLSTNSKNNNTLFFDTRIFPAYLLKLYGHLNIISPWGNNWMLPALIKYKNKPDQLKGYYIGKKMLIQLTAHALLQQPTYIIYNKSYQSHYIIEKNFDVIHYLKQNKILRHELDHYSFNRKINHYIVLERKK